MDLTLHAYADDFRLNANGDTRRDTGTLFSFSYYLTDASGNYLTDPQGNRLIGNYASVQYPQTLHALPDDFNLNSE